MWSSVNFSVGWREVECMCEFAYERPHVWKSALKPGKCNVDSVVLHTKVRSRTAPEMRCEDFVPFPANHCRRAEFFRVQISRNEDPGVSLYGGFVRG